MVFETLYASAQRGELILVDGGLCHYHLRRDGQLTIREILVTEPGQGIGSRLLQRLREVPGATSIFAKCPADLGANLWYARRGFQREAEEVTQTGRRLIWWRLQL